MEDKKKKDVLKSFSVGWGTKGQNNMIDPENEYNHITKTGNSKSSNKGSVHKKDHVVMFRGKNNHAPQKDIQLGLKSITHKSIAEKLARLVCGGGIEFVLKEPKDKNDLTEFEQAYIDEANELLGKGLNKCLKKLSNGVVYHNLSNLIITQGKAEFSDKTKKVNNVVNYISTMPSERMRWSEPIMNDQATEFIPYHYYHKDWKFTGDCNKDKSVVLPGIVPIEEYIRDSKKGERPDKAFFVHSNDSPTAGKQNYISFAVTTDEGIFDGAYPIPKWKSNSSINDIQNEFEASCVRTDYLRNGLHVFAIVNVYSKSFNTTVDNEEGSPTQDWADSLEVVKMLKRSHNSGKVIVNALYTTDPELDGKTTTEDVKLDFPADTYKSLVEQSQAGALTSWSVAPDLFGISVPEGNNLRSQEGFIKMGILLLEQELRLYQSGIEKSIDNLLEFYGMTEVRTTIKKVPNSLYLAVMSDLTKEYASINETREMILGMKPMTEEELKEFIEEKMMLNTTKKKAPEEEKTPIKEPSI